MSHSEAEKGSKNDVEQKSGEEDGSNKDRRKTVDELEREVEELRERLRDLSRVEEDLMADRVFDKAKKRLTRWAALGGTVLILSGVVGIWSVVDFFKTKVAEKTDKFTEEQVNALFSKTVQEKADAVIGQHKTDFDNLAKREKGQLSEIGFDNERGLRTVEQKIELLTAQMNILASSTDGAPQFQPQPGFGPASPWAMPGDQPLGADPTVPLPKSLDLSDKIPATLDTVNYTAWTIARVMEYQIEKKYRERVDLSTKYLLLMGGGRMHQPSAFSPILEAAEMRGVVSAADFPDDSAVGSFSLLPDSERYRITEWHRISGATRMKQHLVESGPLAWGINAHDDLREYTGGIYKRPEDGGAFFGLAVVVVGYDDSEEYWRLRLPWGKEFGEDGCVRIAYGELVDPRTGQPEYPFYVIDGVEREEPITNTPES